MAVTLLNILVSRSLAGVEIGFVVLQLVAFIPVIRIQSSLGRKLEILCWGYGRQESSYTHGLREA